MVALLIGDCAPAWPGWRLQRQWSSLRLAKPFASGCCTGSPRCSSEVVACAVSYLQQRMCAPRSRSATRSGTIAMACPSVSQTCACPAQRRLPPSCPLLFAVCFLPPGPCPPIGRRWALGLAVSLQPAVSAWALSGAAGRDGATRGGQPRPWAVRGSALQHAASGSRQRHCGLQKCCLRLSHSWLPPMLRQLHYCTPI